MILLIGVLVFQGIAMTIIFLIVVWLLPFILLNREEMFLLILLLLFFNFILDILIFFYILFIHDGRVVIEIFREGNIEFLVFTLIYKIQIILGNLPEVQLIN